MPLVHHVSPDLTPDTHLVISSPEMRAHGQIAVDDAGGNQGSQAIGGGLVQPSRRTFAGAHVKRRRDEALLLHALQCHVDRAPFEAPLRGSNKIKAVRRRVGRQQIENEGFEIGHHRQSYITSAHHEMQEMARWLPIGNYSPLPAVFCLQ